MQFETKLTLDKKTIESPDLSDRFTEDELNRLGSHVKENYDRDVQSRENWLNRNSAALDLAMQVQKDKTFPWSGSCYSLDTDILTVDGWKPVADVAVGEMVYSRDEYGIASYHPVREVFRGVSDTVVHFIGKSVDLLVTKNHRMYVENRLGRISFIEAGNLLTNLKAAWKIPLTSKFIGEKPDTIHGIPAKAYMRFLGWFVSEGSCFSSLNRRFSKREGGFVSFARSMSSFNIAQSKQANPETYEMIRADIEACGLSYSANDRSFIVHARSMPQAMKDELRALGTCERKHIPKHVFQLDATLIQELIETLVLGDGHTSKHNGHQTYYTTSKQLADDVQVLCQMIGLRGTIMVGEPSAGGMIRGRPITGELTSYVVNINRKSLCQLGKLQRSEIEWNKEVACVDVAPHHVVYVRRNGKALWCGNSNVAFPLITIAALQFHSRAYPALLAGPDVVQCRVIGPDPDGSKSATADKVSTYMSWQLMEQDGSWEEQMDRALLNVPIVGCAFKKSYYDANKGHNVSELVMAKDLVLNYWARSVEDCPVKTHAFPLSKNTIHSRIMDGTYRDVREEAWFKGDAQVVPPTAAQADSDNRKGLTQPQSDSNTPYSGLEQHLSLDLDHDGYAEPYIVTIEETSQAVLRIVTRFEREQDIEKNPKGEIIRIKPEEYFTKIGFIPSPDGGIYDYGFGVLLGPLNESVNSAINQLFDAGTLSNTAGGFLGRGAKIRGGVYQFSPFEWNRVDSTGDDLRKSLVPLPVREPSMVLFQLLNLIINYTEKVSGAVDISTGGNPGQNTPAQTSQTMVEQGQKVFAAIFKRIWRSLKMEFGKLYQLNGKYLPDRIQFAGSQDYISKADFLGDPSAIIPSADPNIMSDQQRLAKAQAVYQMGFGKPGWDQDELTIRTLKALKEPGIAKIFHGTKNLPPPPPDVKVQVELLKQKSHLQNLEWKKLQFVASLLEQRSLNQAKITNLMAQAAVFEKQAGGIEAGNQIKAFEAAIGALTDINDSITQQIQAQQGDGNDTDAGGPQGNANGAGAGISGMASPSGNGPVLPLGAGQT